MCVTERAAKCNETEERNVIVHCNYCEERKMYSSAKWKCGVPDNIWRNCEPIEHLSVSSDWHRCEQETEVLWRVVTNSRHLPSTIHGIARRPNTLSTLPILFADHHCEAFVIYRKVKLHAETVSGYWNKRDKCILTLHSFFSSSSFSSSLLFLGITMVFRSSGYMESQCVFVDRILALSDIALCVLYLSRLAVI